METHKLKPKGKMLSTFGANAHLERQARNATYHVKSFAQKLGQNIRSLERHFQEEMGKTPHDWLNDLRLSDAKAKLAKLTKREKISHIIVGMGFSDLSHFSNWFLRNTGRRPSDFARPEGKPSHRERVSRNSKPLR